MHRSPAPVSPHRPRGKHHHYRRHRRKRYQQEQAQEQEQKQQQESTESPQHQLNAEKGLVAVAAEVDGIGER